MAWRVQVSRNGRFQFSWHATKKEAIAAAADQRTRHLWSSVRVVEDPVGPIKCKEV